MGHWASGIGHRASGIGHWASGIGHRALPITNYQFSIVPHLSEKGYNGISTLNSVPLSGVDWQSSLPQCLSTTIC